MLGYYTATVSAAVMALIVASIVLWQNDSSLATQWIETRVQSVQHTHSSYKTTSGFHGTSVALVGHEYD